MRFGGLGLQGKFVVALLVAAALPFIVGLVIFESTGFQHLLNERGKFHQMEARTLVRALDQASEAQGEILQTWIEADRALTNLLAEKNLSLKGRGSDEIGLETKRLDEMWESLPADDPRIAGVLENPASASLRKFRKLHPEVAEVLATDVRGRLIAATGKSSDYDQADEAWWRKGAGLPQGGRWTDVLKFDASSGVFSLDVVLPLHEGLAPAGVLKMSIDVTSLFSRLGFSGEAVGERWEIVLPDGRVIASSRPGFVPLGDLVPPDAMDAIRRNHANWMQLQDAKGEARMVGYVGMRPSGHESNAYVLFSSRRDDVVGPLQRSFLVIGVAAACLLTFCALSGYWIIHHNILVPLAALGRAARSISATARLHQPAREDELKLVAQREQVENDLRSIRDIRTGDEVETLAADLAVMTSRVLRYHRELESEVAAKTAVIREDLEMAREFQNALLPSRYPEVPPPPFANPLRLQFAHFYQPATTVGGDFFDLIELDNDRAGILIADVMGHGARSALVTAILRALVRNHSGDAGDPGAFLSELNRHLLEVISRSGQTLFVTAFLLVLDTRAGRASWAVAGHPAPLRVRRGSGKVPEPMWKEPQHQPALGLVADVKFHTHESPLKAGDVFLIYTDGAVEAENPAGKCFGIDRLAASFDEALDGPMAAMPAKIVCDITAYQRRRNYDDDVCIVAVEALGANGETQPFHSAGLSSANG